MEEKELSKELQLLDNLLQVTLKLRHENQQLLYEHKYMRRILNRMGITPNFPEYRDHKERKSA